MSWSSFGNLSTSCEMVKLRRDGNLLKEGVKVLQVVIHLSLAGFFVKDFVRSFRVYIMLSIIFIVIFHS